MKLVVWIVFASAALFGFGEIPYKVYGDVKVFVKEQQIAQDATLKNNTQVKLQGKGKVVFFYPCGAPKVVRVKKEKKLHIMHHCKDNSVAKSLLSNFFDTWFKEDEKIVIAASSRATTNVKRGDNYFVVERGSAEEITIPLYDEDAVYKVVINAKPLDATLVKKTAQYLGIPTHVLDTKTHNRIEIYEDGIKVYDFMVDIISKDFLMQKYPQHNLSLLEKALLYSQETKQQLYVKNIAYLLH
jgi:hypothetical protein